MQNVCSETYIVRNMSLKMKWNKWANVCFFLLQYSNIFVMCVNGAVLEINITLNFFKSDAMVLRYFVGKYYKSKMDMHLSCA